MGSTIGKAIRGFKKAMEEREHIPEDTTDAKKIENK
jgi:Sec-independent protein translocase protein TatA